MGTSTEKITTKLRDQGFSLKVLEHEPVITIADVVRVLQIPTNQMAKTILLFNKNIGLIAVILAGMSRVDYIKVVEILQVPRKSVSQANQEMLEKLDLSPGDIYPFCEFFSKVIVDTTLLEQQTIFCGSGEPQKTIAISPKDMVKATHAIIADISQTKLVKA